MYSSESSSASMNSHLIVLSEMINIFRLIVLILNCTSQEETNVSFGDRDGHSMESLVIVGLPGKISFNEKDSFYVCNRTMHLPYIPRSTDL